MSKIDIDKFICSLIKINSSKIPAIKEALHSQNLEIKDGKIVEIQKEFKFKIGDYIIHNSDSNPFVITKILNDSYEIVSCKDNYDYNLPIQYLESNFHLLTNKTSNWKPNEEQLAWVRDKLKVAEEIDTYNYDTNNCTDVIRSIYKEMLKLKEDNKC